MLDRNLFYDIFDKEQSQKRKEAFITYENLEFPVFKRLNIEDTSFNMYGEFKSVIIRNAKQNGLIVNPRDRHTEVIDAYIRDKKYGVSEKHRKLVESFYNVDNYIEVEDNAVVSEPIYINMDLGDNNRVLFDKTTIVVGESAEAKIVITYNGNSGEQNAALHIIAKRNANLHIIIIQNYEGPVRHYHNALSIIERDGLVKFNRVDIGAREVITDYSSYLENENAASNVDSVYFGDDGSKIDISYNTYHIGKRTNSNVSVKGALKDSSKKVFRGNLYFERGAVKSVGREEEYATLLNEKVKSDSIPALLCDEDDVIGEHAASAGEIDANKLFYLMSRGFSKEEAIKMIVLANFEVVLSSLPDKKLKEDISRIIEVKLKDSI